MAEMKKVIYIGPYPSISIPDYADFDRGVETPVAANRADELVTHKPTEFELAAGETKPADECPCEKHETERREQKERDEAAAAEKVANEKAAEAAAQSDTTQVSGRRTAKKTPGTEVAIGDSSSTS
jgi:hypothetical protein